MLRKSGSVANTFTALRPAQSTLHEAGYELMPDVLDAGFCERLTEALPATRDRRAGTRNVLALETVRSFVASSPVRAIIERFMPEPSVVYAVKATLFEKNEQVNWAVPWHQDRVIAVAAHVPSPEFKGWTRKNGILHVDPPTRVLEQITAFRIHLDDCGEDDGALQVVPGTHRLGKLRPEELRKITDVSGGAMVCAGRGSVLAMKPLLVHRSSAATSSRRRRVLHLELATSEAALPARWHTTVPI